MKTDLSSLFMPRQPAMGSEEAVSKGPFENFNVLLASSGSRDQRKILRSR